VFRLVPQALRENGSQRNVLRRKDRAGGLHLAGERHATCFERLDEDTMPIVNEYMSSDPVTVHGREGLLDAARRMRALHVGCLVVVEDGPRGKPRPVGMLTDRDIVVGVLAETDQKLHLVRVDDVMTRRLVLARETEDLDEVLRRMRGAGVRRVPVVDAEGALKGLLSFDDILQHIEEQVGALASLVGRERRREEAVRH
jgi:CBS domain-containing protein